LDEVRCRRGELKTERRLGKLEGKRAVAKQMLAEGLSISLIVKVTGLNEDEIKALK
jgi:predicted transposase YdaD